LGRLSLSWSLIIGVLHPDQSHIHGKGDPVIGSPARIRLPGREVGQQIPTTQDADLMILKNSGAGKQLGEDTDHTFQMAIELSSTGRGRYRGVGAREHTHLVTDGGLPLKRLPVGILRVESAARTVRHLKLPRPIDPALERSSEFLQLDVACALWRHNKE